MDRKTQEIIWEPDEVEMSMAKMNFRIKCATSQRGWQEVIRIFSEKGIPVDKLNIAEVGCGTGTMSLTFALMGASVTLIDFNEKVLERAGNIYNLYNCQAKFVKADCLHLPPKEVIDAFDLVISVGLAEHFTGEYRKKCIAYHGQLLKKGGVALIAVPNCLSPFYQMIRFIREFRRTWDIDVEVPFSNTELKKLAGEMGFTDSYVIGYTSFYRDFLDYFWGVSVIKDFFPEGLKKAFKKWRAPIKTDKESSYYTYEDMRRYCRNISESSKRSFYRKPKFWLANKYCSRIDLFAFK